MSRKRQYTYGHGFLRGGADDEADLQQVGASTNASASDPDIKYVNLSAICAPGTVSPPGGVGPQLVFEVVRQGAIIQNASNNVVSVERFGVVGAQIPIFVPHLPPTSTDPYTTAYKLGITARSSFSYNAGTSKTAYAPGGNENLPLQITANSIVVGLSSGQPNWALGTGIVISNTGNFWRMDALAITIQPVNLFTTVAGQQNYAYTINVDPSLTFSLNQPVQVQGVNTSGTDILSVDQAFVTYMSPSTANGQWVVGITYPVPFVGGSVCTLGSDPILCPYVDGFAALTTIPHVVTAYANTVSGQSLVTLAPPPGVTYPENLWNTTRNGNVGGVPSLPSIRPLITAPLGGVGPETCIGFLAVNVCYPDGGVFSSMGINLTGGPWPSLSAFASAVNTAMAAGLALNSVYFSSWTYTWNSVAGPISPNWGSQCSMSMTRTSVALPPGYYIEAQTLDFSDLVFGFSNWPEDGVTQGYPPGSARTFPINGGASATTTILASGSRTYNLTPMTPVPDWEPQNDAEVLTLTSPSNAYQPAVFTRQLTWTPQYPPLTPPKAPAANGGVIDLQPGDRTYLAYDPPAVLAMVNAALADIWASVNYYTQFSSASPFTNTATGASFPGLQTFYPLPPYFTCDAGVINLHVPASSLTDAFWGMQYPQNEETVNADVSPLPWAGAGYPAYMFDIQMNHALYTHLFSGFACVYEPTPQVTACGGLLRGYPSSDWLSSDGGVYSLTMPPPQAIISQLLPSIGNMYNILDPGGLTPQGYVPPFVGPTTYITVPQAGSCTDAWAAASALAFTTTLPIIAEDDTAPAYLGGGLPSANQATSALLTDVAPDLAGGVLDWGAGTRLNYSPTIKRVALMSGGPVQRIQVAAWWRSRDNGKLYPVTMGAAGGGDLKLEFRQKR